MEKNIRFNLTNTIFAFLQTIVMKYLVLVQSIPTYRNPTPIWDPRSCSLVAIRNGTCSRDIPTAFIDDLQHASRDAIEAVAKTTGSSVLDLRRWFCDAKTCSTDKDGAFQYQDATHLTVSASSALAPQFVEAINSTQ
ncbi:SGNH hydrolase domain-containing protein [uncultured Thiocystis sp.]|jgi:hypothetical protein|uniref:SGNH hydrolase domain-containing protein n=1 Tax=uncultured Thiocystis sp. TaxID=1202134 RepID=UPI00343042E4